MLHFELGYKATYLDGTLQLNTAIYTYIYEGYQDSVNIFDPLTSSFRDIPVNTGDATNSGFEVEMTWLATDSLTLSGNYSYTETEYKDDVFFLENDDPSKPLPLFPCTPTAADPEACPQIFNVKGGSLKGIPEHKAIVWGTYTWSTDIGRIAFNTSVSYTGEYNNGGMERDIDKVPERTNVNMSLIWSSLDERLRARLFVDNVFDERMYRDIDAQGVGSNYKMTGSLLQTRYWGLDLSYIWGNG